MAKRSTAAPFASVPLEESSSTPLYYQVYQRLRAAILLGQLSPGTRLPSTRQMASDLGVSRNTMMSAFDQLIAEGYVEGRVGAGTFVSPTLPEELLEARLKPKLAVRIQPDRRALSARGKVLAKTTVTVANRSPGKMRPFIPGIPALDQFPMALWSRLVARRWRDESRGLLNYGPAAGYRPLREAIAAYLGPSRGVQCKPDQIVVVSGTQQALDLAARVLLDPGDSILVEEYCYSAARAALSGAGARLVPVKVDDAGLDISQAASSSNAPVAYVTPSHQYPMGVTMSLSRRLALLDWANRTSAWILEDDYDSEYRYVARPLAALQGLDKSGRVIYIGTFSKVLFPSLRIGYMVAPSDLVDAFVRARAAVGWCCPIIDQAVLADFINEGHFTRHIRRMRALYAERQDALISALHREAGELLEVRRTDAGIHVIGFLPDHIDDRVVAEEAANHDIVAHPLSSFFLGDPELARGGLVLGYGAYNSRQLREGAGKLAAALKTVARNPSNRDRRMLRTRVLIA